MTLLFCYRATCDAPGCYAGEMLPHSRTWECRRQLAALGWAVIEHRVAISGAPRLLYACPAHRDWKPEGLSGRDATRNAQRRSAMIWLLHGAGVSYASIAAAFGLSVSRVEEMAVAYQHSIARRGDQAKDWSEPWAQRLRAAGAIL